MREYSYAYRIYEEISAKTENVFKIAIFQHHFSAHYVLGACHPKSKRCKRPEPEFVSFKLLDESSHSLLTSNFYIPFLWLRYPLKFDPTHLFMPKTAIVVKVRNDTKYKYVFTLTLNGYTLIPTKEKV
jgi:hypothetical protein